jgi:hypothetical protein
MNPRQIFWVSVLRPYSPGGLFHALAQSRVFSEKNEEAEEGSYRFDSTVPLVPLFDVYLMHRAHSFSLHYDIPRLNLSMSDYVNTSIRMFESVCLRSPHTKRCVPSRTFTSLTTNRHRLGCRLHRSLICFTPYTFVAQRQ